VILRNLVSFNVDRIWHKVLHSSSLKKILPRVLVSSDLEKLYKIYSQNKRVTLDVCISGTVYFFWKY